MKYIIYFVTFLMTFIVLSCSSDEEQQILMKTDSESVINTYKVQMDTYGDSDPNGLFTMDSVDSLSDPQTRIGCDIMPLLDYVYYTVKGATNTSASVNQKVLISTKLAKLMGISRQTYVMNYITATYSITIDGLSSDRAVFKIVDSPECGIDPSKPISDYERGYTFGSNGDVVTLTTTIIHILSDLDGRNYNMYYPCKPENLVWNYRVAAE